jgi:hypothetical protein
MNGRVLPPAWNYTIEFTKDGKFIMKGEHPRDPQWTKNGDFVLLRDKIRFTDHGTLTRRANTNCWATRQPRAECAEASEGGLERVGPMSQASRHCLQTPGEFEEQADGRRNDHILDAWKSGLVFNKPSIAFAR